MTVFSVIMLCLVSFMLGINLAGYAFLPGKFPWNWWHNLGSVFFAVAIIFWEAGKK